MSELNELEKLQHYLELKLKYNKLLEFVKEIGKTEPESFKKYPQASILINNAINILEEIGESA